MKQPSNYRDWQEDVAILPEATIESGKISLKNIRNFRYRSETDFDPGYYHRTYELAKLKEAYLGIVPFSKNPLIAHLLLKFVFEDEEIVFSAEVRKQKGQRFIAWRTLFRNYELAYIFGAPSDLIELREKHRKNEPVHFYKLNLNAEQLGRLFTGLCVRANKLGEYPEFFHLFLNSCGSNIIGHINEAAPKKIHWFYRLFAPGLLRRELLRKKLIC